MVPSSTSPGGSPQFIDAPDRDLYRLTAELVPGSGDLPRIVPRESPALKVGRVDTFWLVDLLETQAYQSDFELVLITDHAYWYVEEGMSVATSAIERSANRFEDEIYPVPSAPSLYTI